MDWRDAAQEKLRAVGDAIAQDVQILLDGESQETVTVTLSDGTTQEITLAEAEAAL